MIESIAKWTVIGFGLFFICVGLTMLLNPEKAREILHKAGSTNFINYAEITLRLIPAAALILSADLSKYPEAFKILGWFAAYFFRYIFCATTTSSPIFIKGCQHFKAFLFSIDFAFCICYRLFNYLKYRLIIY